MPDLFEAVDIDPRGRPKGHPDYDPFDFPDNHQPSGQAPEETDEYETVRGSALALKNTDRKRKAQPTHIPRASALLETMHPGCLLYVAEKRVTTYSGQIVKVDQWGFADLVGITAKGAWIAANVTTTAAMAAHMREYTNPVNTHGVGARRVVDLLERYLELRGVFYIIGYDQPGGAKTAWVPTVWTVTQSLIDEYKARKRSR